MKEVVITSKVVGREGAGVPAKIGQGSTVDLSAYLLKALWDKVWEIRTDSTGQEYIFGKLPVVTQYGITMYAGDGGDIDLPSLYAGLPIDNTTIYWENGVLKAVGSSGGGGVADSVAWANVYGKPSWITDTKPTYAYSEITGTPDLTKYALKADIPSLSGYATEQWVIGKGYALDADLDVLATIVGNKADKTELAKYIPISGYTEISGEKNFVGGLKVNGSPIVYDATNKYWKLEGDLLVTGGVTMYANEGTYTPSTIMDALLYDDTTLGINSEGKLYVKGGTGGGLDITALQNYLTQNSYLNVTEGDDRYLKLSGGELNGSLSIGNNTTTSSLLLSVARNNEKLSLLISGAKEGWLLTNYEDGKSTALIQNESSGLLYKDTSDNYRYVLHVGNYSSYALPLSGGTISASSGIPLTIHNSGGGNVELSFKNSSYKTTAVGKYGSYSYLAHYKDGSNVGELRISNNGTISFGDNTIWHEGNFKPSNYLPLSGGTLTGALNLPIDTYNYIGSNISLWVKSDTPNALRLYAPSGLPSIAFFNNDGWKGTLGVNENSDLLWTSNKVWHAGNDGSGSGLDADMLDGQHLSDILASNVASATKLQTARSIWGQSFDGTGNITGQLNITTGTNVALTYGTGLLTLGAMTSAHIAIDTNDIQAKANGTTASTLYLNDYGGNVSMCGNGGNVGIGTSGPSYKLHVQGDGYYNSNLSVAGGLYVGNSSVGYMQLTRPSANYITTPSSGYLTFCMGGNALSVTTSNLVLYQHNIAMALSGGNVGIGTTSPAYKFHVAGDSYLAGVCYINKYTTYDSQPYTANPEVVARIGTFDHLGGLVIQFGSAADTNVNGRFEIIDKSWKVALFSVDTSGNVLANGGITMYSDQRKKTILRNVELSLKEIANAPLIEHYYNSDDKKTTHVGSIAQYWAGLNDWFCKLDNEGYYTMEIQNAALASAISVARELDRYENKTDKTIKKLKKRICELEEEVERLKAN